MSLTHRTLGALAATALAFTVTACATAKGVQTDAERATENVSAGMETMDVKGTLIADGRIDASNINVDTNAKTRTVVLKGSVPSEDQKKLAEELAQREAPDYKIVNQLTVAPPKG